MPKPLPRMNFLTSYFFMKDAPKFTDIMVAISPWVNTIIDSGAFSDHYNLQKARREGKSYTTVKVEDYIQYCKRYLDGRVGEYIALDVMYDPEGSERNLSAMVEAGLKPMPVFVHGDTYDRLLELVEINERVCISGGVAGTRRYNWQKFQRSWIETGGRIRIHGLGFVKYPDIFSLPLFSVDSSSVSSGSRFGTIAMYSPLTGIDSIPWKKALQERDPVLLRYLFDCGVTPDMLKDNRYFSKTYGVASLLNVYAHIRMAKHAAHAGLRYYFSLPNVQWVCTAIGAIAGVQPDGSFHYPTARTEVIRLRELHNVDMPGLVESARKILQAQTDYTDLTWEPQALENYPVNAAPPPPPAEVESG